MSAFVGGHGLCGRRVVVLPCRRFEWQINCARFHATSANVGSCAGLGGATTWSCYYIMGAVLGVLVWGCRGSCCQVRLEKCNPYRLAYILCAATCQSLSYLSRRPLYFSCISVAAGELQLLWHLGCGKSHGTWADGRCLECHRSSHCGTFNFRHLGPGLLPFGLSCGFLCVLDAESCLCKPSGDTGWNPKR